MMKCNEEHFSSHSPETEINNSLSPKVLSNMPSNVILYFVHSFPCYVYARKKKKVSKHETSITISNKYHFSIKNT